MPALYWTIVVKTELSAMVKLLIYQSIYIPTHTKDHKLWVVTDRRLGIQEAEMSFHRQVAGLSLRDKLRSSDIWGE